MRDEKSKNELSVKENPTGAEMVPADVPSTETPEEKPRSSRTFIIAILVLVVAVGVVAAILFRNRNMTQELADLQTSLKESQNRWQEIAAEKEELQAQLAVVEEGIREARLTYEESTAKIADLTEQVASLTAQNTSLESQLTIAADAEAMYTRQAGEISDSMAKMQSSGEALNQEIESQNPYTGGLWNGLFNARYQILESLKAKKKALSEDLASSQAMLGALTETGMEAKADQIRADIQALEKQLEEVRNEIRMYGIESDLED